jgi:UDP-N-acetylglucosamine 2-epimerase
MPEEINRLMCDHISAALFCPTDTALNNLKNEGITQGVYQVGDVMIDSLEMYRSLANQRSTILKDLNIQAGSYALVTIHRAGNTDDPARLKNLLAAFGQLHLTVVFPVHPRTRKVIEELRLPLPKNILAIEPVSYLDMVQLEAHADCILTDSGGIQKEAYWLGVRAVTLREETEWVETVTAGWNCLVGANPAAIVSAVQTWRPVSERLPLYGDGHAAQKICEILVPNTTST